MNSVFSIPSFVSVSDLQRNYSGLLKKLARATAPLYVIRKSDVEAVLVSPQAYQALVEKAYNSELLAAKKAVGVYKLERKNKSLKKMVSPSELFE